MNYQAFKKKDKNKNSLLERKINVQGKNGEEKEELRNKLLSLIVLIALLNFIQVRIHKDKKTK